MTTAWGGGAWGENSYGGVDEVFAVAGVNAVGGTGTVFVTGDGSFAVTGVSAQGTVGDSLVSAGSTCLAIGVWATGKVGQVTTRSTWSFVDDIQDAVWQNTPTVQIGSWTQVIL